MRVKLLINETRFNIKAGDIFSAERYRYDPDKVTLLKRESDGFEPECNQYKEDLAYWMSGQWWVLDGTAYVPEQPTQDKQNA